VAGQTRTAGRSCIGFADVSATAVLDVNQAALFEKFEGFAHHIAADSELHGQSLFGGQGAARAVDAGDDGLFDLAGNLIA